LPHPCLIPVATPTKWPGAGDCSRLFSLNILVGREPLSLDPLVLLQKAIAFAAIALLLIAAYSDIRTLKIPNTLVLAIAVLGIIRLILLNDSIAAIFAIGFAALVFLIGFVLFLRGIVGAGDVKLLVATVLVIRYPDLLTFLIRMSIFGALLSVGVIVLRSYVPLLLGPRVGSFLSTIPRSVPYGVAIAAAGIITILLQPVLFRYVVALPSFQ
jgi:prepilin peptidase CpaA